MVSHSSHESLIGGDQELHRRPYSGSFGIACKIGIVIAIFKVQPSVYHFEEEYYCRHRYGIKDSRIS